jgi:xanthine dehydrogenase accessory factor
MLRVPLLAALVLAGCGPSVPEPQSTPAYGGAFSQVVPAQQATGSATANVICPVSGDTVKDDIYAVYNGKRVYFCSPECKDAFLKEPRRYLHRLPQFR